MKTDIHPTYGAATVICACGNTFETKSTKSEININSCSSCHPIYTGQAKFVDTEGRVERFRKRYAK